MPISKNGELYYTDEQFRIAKFETTALQYAKNMNMPLEQKGKYFVCKEHDSLIFAPNGKFFWNSHKESGDAIKLACEYYGKTFVQAILSVAGEEQHYQMTKNEVTTAVEKQRKIIAENNTETTTTVEKKPFTLPNKANDFKRVYGYLCGERKIDNQILSTMIHEKRIYQSKEHNNVVFVGYDKDGVARSATMRGTISFLKEAFRGDVESSEKEIPFTLPAEKAECDTVYVFEASIDVLSHASLIKLTSNTQMWRDVNRIALCGTCDNALMWYLDNNPQIKNVCLCLDNDTAGQKATNMIGEKLAGTGYNVTVQKSNGKDWNDDLKAFTALECENNRITSLANPIMESGNDIELEM